MKGYMKYMAALLVCSFALSSAVWGEEEIDGLVGTPTIGTVRPSGTIRDVISSPGIELGLPTDKYVEVNNLNTSGLGTSQDAANIIFNLQESLHAGTDKNDLMHWYVSAGANVHYCTPNSFRCDYENTNGNRTAVVLAVWLPRTAKEITLDYQSYSRGMSVSIWTYNYMTDTMLLHYEANNEWNNSHGPDSAINISHTYTSGSVNESFTGQYLLVMFNTSEKEKTWLDINGFGVSYTALNEDDEVMINPFRLEDDDFPGSPAIPEPAGGVLSLLAVMGLAVRRRR